MGRSHGTTVLLAVGLLAVGLLPATAGASEGDGDTMEQRYVLGGTYLKLEYPPDPVPIVELKEAVGVAACGPLAEAPVVAGGACFSIPDDAHEVRVEVEETAPVPGDDVAFAAGFDGDDDGCVGCTSADVLQRSWNSQNMVRLDTPGPLVVFVYGYGADTDTRFGRSGTGSTGLITVTPVDEGPTPQDASGDHTTEGPSAHLCVPACT